MARTSRAEWIRRVARWRESKTSADEFAAQHGIKAVRLRYWDWKLKRLGDGTPLTERTS
jgi:hypothetical protein